MAKNKNTSPVDEPFISKSQAKREMDALQVTGLELVKLTDNQLKTIPLDDELHDAILLARRIQNKHEGFRRQMQFIGKLMRQRDVQPITEALDQLKGNHRKTTAYFHSIEQWRDRILSQGEEAIQELCESQPTADPQQLRHYCHEHQQQLQHNKPPMASRQLFVYLRQLMSSQ
ncbi:MAG: ribosome biogenesis factor YjgA [Pseudomonadota bacterium]